MPDRLGSVRRIATALVVLSLLVGTAGAVPAADFASLGSTASAQTAGTVELTATITDANGDPVTNATVSFLTGGVVSESKDIDANGQVTVDLEAHTEYQIRLSQERDDFPADGVPDLYTVGTVNVSSDATRSYQLPAPTDTEITVVDRSGQAFADVTVDVTSLDSDGESGATFTNIPTTDENGRMVVDGNTTIELAGRVSAQTISFGLSDPYTRNTTTATVEDDSTIEVETVRKPLLSGQVTLANGSKADGLLTFDADNLFAPENEFLSEGNYSVYPFPDVEYEIGYESGVGTTAGDSIPDVYAVGTERISSDRTRDISLPSGFETDITVVDGDGNPVSEADVTVTHSANGVTASKSGTTNENGIVSADLTGDVEISVSGSQQYGSASQTATITEAGTVQIQVPDRVTVTGELTTPDGDAFVGQVFASSGASSAFFGPTVDDVDGTFSVNVTENVAHDYTASQTDAEGNSFPRDGVADLFEFDSRTLSSDTDLGTATAPEGYLTTLTVRNESGPVPGAGVTVYTLDNDEDLRGVAFLTTDENGELSAFGSSQTGLELNGQYLFSVDPPEDSGLADTINRTVTVTGPTEIDVGASAPDRLSVSVSPSSLTAGEATDVTVTVTNASSGAAVSGATVTVPALSQSATTDASGTASLSINASAATTLEVTATADGFENGTATIDVAAAGIPADAVYNAGTTAAEYDSDGDGRIAIGELGSAAVAFSNGELSIAALGNVATAFSAS